jgi:hypothetical protein
MLPLLAKQADKYSLIRSMTHRSNAHETATYMMQTGRNPGERLVYPSMGAVVSLFKGYDHGYKSLIPPYVVLTTALGRFSEVGFLGPKYKPFVTGGDPNKTPFAVEGIVAEGITEQRQKDRRQLLSSLDSLGQALPDNDEFKRFDQCQNNAYEMILGDARKLFDLSQEKAELRDQYGRTTFGQSCLMARRLVEHGVPYVAINYGGWDTHKQHFETMRRKLPEYDKGLATLLQDLSSRGLLDSTIVSSYGDFGRTQSPVGRALERRTRTLRQLLFGPRRRRRLQGRLRGRCFRCPRRRSRPASRLSAGFNRHLLQLMGIDPDGRCPTPWAWISKSCPRSTKMVPQPAADSTKL